MTRPTPDWQPLDEQAATDQIAHFDALRARCPVAFSDELGWSVFRHADVAAVLADHDTFSNKVSRHLSVPNGMDPPEHTALRRVIDPYFAPERVAAYKDEFRAIAADLVGSLPDGESEIMRTLAHPFAARVQCAFMGWPDELDVQLQRWAAESQDATRRQDRQRLAELADDFDSIIRAQLDIRRDAGERASVDTTSQLLAERIDGRPLTDDELVSIIRNWTAGELATIAASIGILVNHLAGDIPLQHQLRSGAMQRSRAIDEILRLDGPLVANRRVTTRPAELGGRQIAAGERVTIMWPSANRDEQVFGTDVFAPDEHSDDNLLYGAGIHVCPGAPLARLELDVMIDVLLCATREIVPAGPAVRAHYPAGGYVCVAARIVKQAPAR